MASSNTSYKQLFTHFPEQNLSSEIETRVMARIERSRAIRARFHIALHATSILIAVILCVPVIHNFMTISSQSGLASYLSLFASDGTYMMSSWKDIALSIMSSIPIFETTLILGLILIIANALRRGTRYIHTLNQYEHLRVLS